MLTCKWSVSPGSALTSEAYPSIATPSPSGASHAVVPDRMFSARIGSVVSEATEAGSAAPATQMTVAAVSTSRMPLTPRTYTSE